jgi:mercuric ion binding protein
MLELGFQSSRKKKKSSKGHDLCTIIINLKEKNMRNLFLILTIVLGSMMSMAQSKSKVVEIQTSAECGTCKDKIESTLNYTAGIKFAELNLLTKKVKVKYIPSKISIEKIRHIISETGYDADKVKANPESVQKLPKCCQPGGMKKH